MQSEEELSKMFVPTLSKGSQLISSKKEPKMASFEELYREAASI